MVSHTLHTCSICNEPVQMNDGDRYALSNPKKTYRRREAVVLDIGYSRGGWGHREQWLTFSSEMVCGECFDQIEALVRPLQQFVRGGERRDPLHPVRDQEPSPGGRGTSILRPVRALLSLKA